MKNLIVVLITLVGLNSQANEYKVQSGDLALSPISGQISSVDHLACIALAGRNCPATTLVTVKFVLFGCVDRLGPVAYKAVPRGNGDVDVYMSALNVHTDLSTRVNCIRATEAEQTILLATEYYEIENIHIHYLGAEYLAL